MAGVGLAGLSVDWVFAHQQPALIAYLCFIGAILCPIAWLLGQTVPILTNLMQTQHTGEASGMALHWSTLGSFLGSLTLSLLVMQWLGVSAAVVACAVGLLIGVLLPATIESVFGRCAVDGLHKGKPLANVELACFASSQPIPAQLYGDEKNRADLDRALSY